MPLQSTSGAATYDAFGTPSTALITQADAIDFDGTNDYLSRGSLSGAANSSTFTLSCWVYVTGAASGLQVLRGYNSTTTYFYLQISDKIDSIQFYQSGSIVLNANTTAGTLAINTWNNILISVNMSGTGTRAIYINDVAVTTTWAIYVVGTTFSFSTLNTWKIASSSSTPNYLGRLSNVFLDYTYRALSNVANRRLFITADLEPAAGQAALNPILYLPMSDPTQPGLNQGTGGNFTLTGTVARSGRGPNQYNAPYSTFDGAADYLNRGSITGIADGKQVTFSCSFKHAAINSANYLFASADASNGKIQIFTQSGGSLTVRLRDAAAANVLVFTLPNSTFVVGRNYVLTFSVDLSDTAKRSVYVNGTAASATWTTYTNADADLTNTNYTVGAAATTTVADYFNGTIGALWFNTSYIDLSVPSNLAKFVTGTGIDAKPVDPGANGELPTGTSPLIYLPMYGSSANINKGTGGNFNAISGPYTGARGPNEFWGNKANFGNSTSNDLTKSSGLSGIGSTNKFSTSFWINITNSPPDVVAIFKTLTSGFANALEIRIGESATNFDFYIGDPSGTQYLHARTTSPTISTGTWYHVMASFDLSDTAKRSVYINGSAATVTYFTYTNGSVGTSTQGYFNAGSAALDSVLSEFYFTTDYIDFSVEANRLKFRDCFGNPTDLPSAITALSIPNPAVYMRFPPTSFGTNSGTGGNFTVSGTITDGGQL